MILNKEEFLKKADGTTIVGEVLINNYEASPTKNGGSYFAGNMQAVGDVPFKVWSGNCYNLMDKEDFRDCICCITGDVNEYNGAKSVIIKDIYALSEEELKEKGYSKFSFFKPKYDENALWNKLCKTLSANVSEGAMKVFNLIMCHNVGDCTVKDLFVKEYAAINYHDNCISGLMAHTVKVETMCKICKLYPNIYSRVSPDVLYIGIALHDIGKVFEYNKGSISEQGKYLSHNTIGVILISQYRDEIIRLTSENFYIQLLAIISEHHGEFGDRPRTIGAYVINQLDCLDATLTLLDQNLEDTPEGQLRFDGMKLI